MKKFILFFILMLMFSVSIQAYETAPLLNVFKLPQVGQDTDTWGGLLIDNWEMADTMFSHYADTISTKADTPHYHNANDINDSNYFRFANENINIDSISFDPSLSIDTLVTSNIIFDTGFENNDIHTEGRLHWDNVTGTLELDLNNDGRLTIGQEQYAQGINLTGDTIYNGNVCYVSDIVGGFPSLSLAIADSSFITTRIIGIATQDISNGTTGRITTFGLVRDLDLSEFSNNDLLYLSADTEGTLTNIVPTLPNQEVLIALVLDNSSTSGILITQLRTGRPNTSKQLEFLLSGTVETKPKVYLTVTDTQIYASVYNNSDETEEIIVNLDGIERFVPVDTVALNLGDSTTPVQNNIYYSLSSGVVTLNATTELPTDTFAWIGKIACFDTQSTIDYGVLNYQRYTDSRENNYRGRISHISEKIRVLGATWWSGVESTLERTIQAPEVDTIQLNVTSGLVYQMHRQNFSADTSFYYVVNYPNEPYKKVSHLGEIDVDAEGNSLRGNNTYYGLEIFANQNSQDEDGNLFVLLPSGEYGSSDEAIADASNYSITSVPTELRQTAFRICRVVLRFQTSSNTLTNVLGGSEVQDRRSFPFGIGGGGLGSSTTSTFSDASFNVYDDADVSKIVKLQNSGITIGTTRTLTIPDTDGTILTSNNNKLLISEVYVDTAYVNGIKTKSGETLYANELLGFTLRSSSSSFTNSSVAFTSKGQNDIDADFITILDTSTHPINESSEDSVVFYINYRHRGNGADSECITKGRVRALGTTYESDTEATGSSTDFISVTAKVYIPSYALNFVEWTDIAVSSEDDFTEVDGNLYSVYLKVEVLNPIGD